MPFARLMHTFGSVRVEIRNYAENMFDDFCALRYFFFLHILIPFHSLVASLRMVFGRDCVPQVAIFFFYSDFMRKFFVRFFSVFTFTHAYIRSRLPSFYIFFILVCCCCCCELARYFSCLSALIQTGWGCRKKSFQMQNCDLSCCSAE